MISNRGNSIDQQPYYDPMTKDGSYISDVWMASISSLIDTLNDYLTQFGVLIPLLTVDQKSTIQSPVEGQMIYVSDANTPTLPRDAELQIWQVKAGIGAWRTITTVP